MVDQLQHLEEEQEQLNSSLLALTTHFAQVQFRLKQIVNAPIDEKEVGHITEHVWIHIRPSSVLQTLHAVLEDFRRLRLTEF